MVRVLSLALPLLTLASQALATYYGSELIGRDVDLAVRHAYPETSVEASLFIDIELKTELDVIIGLFGIDLGMEVDVEVGKGAHLCVGLGLQAHKGLSLEVCIRALLAKVVLTIDGTTTCSGPSKKALKQSLYGRKTVPCQCTDPNVYLELVIPDISLEVEATATLLAQIELLFSLTKDTKKHSIVASKPKVQFPEPKKYKMGYEKTIHCQRSMPSSSV
jgi:hypothetical protein